MTTTSNEMHVPRFTASLHIGARQLTIMLMGVVIVAAVLIGVAAQPAQAISGGGSLPTQLVSTATAECPGVPGGCAGTTLGAGQVLTVTFNETPDVAPDFNLSLTDGTNKGTIDSSNATAVAVGSTVTYT